MSDPTLHHIKLLPILSPSLHPITPPSTPPPPQEDRIKDQERLVGDTLTLKKVKRLHMGSYLCIASNNVPPSISKRIELSIQCRGGVRWGGVG